jgi:AAA15 family ATPase/GTPase
MKITELQIENLKSHSKTDIKFSPSINLLIGQNNAGKSTVLKAIYALQLINTKAVSSFVNSSKRKFTQTTKVSVKFDKFETPYLPDSICARPNARIIEYGIVNNAAMGAVRINELNGQNIGVFQQFQRLEPNNFIYPYFSNRKSGAFAETINRGNTVSVGEKNDNLYNKIDRISNSQFPAFKEYEKICQEILGFVVTTGESDGGKKACFIVDNFTYIPIDEMGDGVVSLLGLVVSLCIAKSKLFLIEELENDLHPNALKGLLSLIIEKSKSNQFIISTHSNIVAKYLGSESNSKIFQVNMELIEQLPSSTVVEIENTPSSRIKVLEGLGYDLFDFDLWKAYLILEESTAERIIKDFLIPTFAPKLYGKLKTIAASGVDDIEPRVHDFLRLFVFVHTSEAYTEKAWVCADGDKVGLDVITKLKGKFPTWNKEHFVNFSKKNFEEYYPSFFEEEVKKVLSMTRGLKKQKEKGKLVNNVMEWVFANREEAEKGFGESAKEIISFLKSIEMKMK